MSIALLEEMPLAPTTELGPFRRWDYEALPDEPRCELIFGRFYVSPSPFPLHQRVLFELAQTLDAQVRASGAEVFLAPLDVTLADHSIVQPDLVVLRAERRHLVGRGVEGPPDLVIEILSPGSIRRDRLVKLNLYAQTGVREYWLVDPQERQIDFLVNQDGRFMVTAPESRVYTSPVLPEISLDLVAFWTKVEQRVRGKV